MKEQIKAIHFDLKGDDGAEDDWVRTRIKIGIRASVNLCMGAKIQLDLYGEQDMDQAVRLALNLTRTRT